MRLYILMIHFLSRTRKKELGGIALLRLDFNTEDEWRMEALLPTVRFLSRVARAVVIVSHRGRPASIKITAGKPNGADMYLSLKSDAAHLAKLLRKKVAFIPHFRFSEIKKTLHASPHGAVFLLENIRFLKEEMTTGENLSRSLASLADYYVNDAFAVSHRDEASMTGVPRLLPRYAGFELERELFVLPRVCANPKKPLVVVLGGGKTKDKLGVIRSLQEKASVFLLGGAAANAILHLRGVDVKRSRRDENGSNLPALQRVAGMKKVVVPHDWRMENDAILDIGPKTAAEFGKHIASARTILWSGPLGLIENRKFNAGTLAVARAVVANKKALSIAGGGETVMFLKKHKLGKKFRFISTGGGAMLEFLAGKRLPGIEALKTGKYEKTGCEV